MSEAHDVNGEAEGGHTVDQDGGTVRGGEAGGEGVDGRTRTPTITSRCRIS